MQEKRAYDVHLVSKIEGVVLPTWVAIALAAAGSAAAISLLIVAFVLSHVEREIRILELDTDDMQSIVIRAGMAKRSDFATWDPQSAPGKRHAASDQDEQNPQPKKEK